MKTKIFLLLCLLMCVLVSACSNSSTALPASGTSSDAMSSAAGSEASEAAETSAHPESAEPSQPSSLPQNLLEEAEGPVPDFLDAEQQILYKKAKTAYMEFTLYNGGFGSEGSEGSEGSDEPALEKDGMQYYKCNGSITKWADFEDSMLSVFTAEYFEELNNAASYTDGNGVLHERTIFAEQNGDLYYSGGARGSNITFVEPEAFELQSESDTEIRFHVIGTYDDFAYDKDGNILQQENGDYQRAGNPVQETYTLILQNSPDGWRFSEFQLAY